MQGSSRLSTNAGVGISGSRLQRRDRDAVQDVVKRKREKKFDKCARRICRRRCCWRRQCSKNYKVAARACRECTACFLKGQLEGNTHCWTIFERHTKDGGRVMKDRRKTIHLSEA